MRLISPLLLPKAARPLVLAAIALATLLAYWPVQNFPFVNYDDNEYVYANKHVMAGLTPENIGWAFTSTDAANWHPVTWLSLMLDHDLYGSEPGGYHLTNLCLHVFNAMLLFIVLLGATGALWRSALVSLLFALHPLHVESVAWISERKDLLCTFFGILSLWTYVRYAKNRGISNYLWALLFFALGLMSKPMIVTLPFVMLLLDVWPLNRLACLSSKTTAVGPGDSRSGSCLSIMHALGEKIPFFLFTVTACLITLYAQRDSVAGGSSVVFRISNACLSYVLYLERTVWPAHLAFFYPLETTVSGPAAASSILLLCALSVAAVKTLPRSPWFFVGWFWFLGTLVPAIGIVQVGEQSMADRYSYVPLVGIFIIVAWGTVRLVSNSATRTAVASACALVVIAVFGILARKQILYWQDSCVLFRHALAVTRNNSAAHNNLGSEFYNRNRLDSALSHFSQTLAFNPTHAVALYNIGFILRQEGKPGEALQFLRRAVASDPAILSLWSVSRKPTHRPATTLLLGSFAGRQSAAVAISFPLGTCCPCWNTTAIASIAPSALSIRCSFAGLHAGGRITISGWPS